MHGPASLREAVSGPPAVLDLSILLCLLAGDTIGPLLFSSEGSALGLSPLFWSGVALVVLRHVVWPRPTILEVIRDRARRRLSRPPAARLATLGVLSRTAVLAVGLAASLTFPERLTVGGQVSRDPIVNLPARWDAWWYMGIARNGYRWNPDRRDREQNVAFFPAYPLAMRLAGDILTVPAKLLRAPDLFGSGTGRVMWGGTLISILCFTLALPVLYRLARSDTGEDGAAWRSCVLLAAYPFAMFFSVPYSEALALLALVSLAAAWRDGDVGRGALWGIVLGLCRSNGWTMTAALVLDRVLGRPAAWRGGWSWTLVAAAPVAGASLYSAYLSRLTGNPLEWVTAQRAWGRAMRPVEFFARRWDMVEQQGLAGYVAQQPVDALTFLCAAGMIAAAIRLAVERRWLYAGIVAAYLAPAIVIDLPATGRMTALLFPAFILMGRRIRGAAFAALVGLSAAGQAWLAWRFFLWFDPF